MRHIKHTWRSRLPFEKHEGEYLGGGGFAKKSTRESYWQHIKALFPALAADKRTQRTDIDTGGLRASSPAPFSA